MTLWQRIKCGFGLHDFTEIGTLWSGNGRKVKCSRCGHVDIEFFREKR